MVFLYFTVFFGFCPIIPRYSQTLKERKKESGTEIGNSLEFRFRRPTSAQLSRAVKADEISVVETTQPLRPARKSKDN